MVSPFFQEPTKYWYIANFNFFVLLCNQVPPDSIYDLGLLKFHSYLLVATNVIHLVLEPQLLDIV